MHDQSHSIRCGRNSHPCDSIRRACLFNGRQEARSSLSPEDLNSRFKRSWNQFKSQTQLYDISWWRLVVDDVFRDEHFPDKERFFSDLYETFSSPDVWRIYPDVLPVLSELKKRNLLLAVASNWDDRLPYLLKTLKLDSYFSFQFISCELKKAKPNLDFFKSALAKLNLVANEVIHVGDDQENDFSAPQKLGIQSYLIERGKRASDNNVISTLYALIEKVDKDIHI